MSQLAESVWRVCAWKSRKGACVAPLSMLIGCFCVSCNIHSHHFLQNYQSTQLVFRMDRTVHHQVDGCLDPVLVHEPVLSAIWWFASTTHEPSSCLAATRTPRQVQQLETLQHSFDDQLLCLLSIQIAKGRGHIQTLIWHHSQDEGGSGSSSHLVGVWLHWTPSIMGRSAICPSRNKHLFWMQMSPPCVKFFLESHLSWTGWLLDDSSQCSSPPYDCEVNDEPCTLPSLYHPNRTGFLWQMPAFPKGDSNMNKYYVKIYLT